MDTIKSTNDIFRKQFTFIELFAGIGGFRIAFERAGAKCVWSNDNDKYCAITYISNFGAENFVLSDIRNIPTSEIPCFDILCGGFPCQPFSQARQYYNKKYNLDGFNDTNGNLFFEIIRIMKHKKPLAYILENVKNLKYHDKGKTFNTIKDYIVDLGYSFYYKIIDSKLLVPQHRERIYIVGFKDGYNFNFPTIKDKKPKLKDILENDVSEKYTLTDKTWRYLKNKKEEYRKKGCGFGYTIANLSSYTRTLTARYGKDGSEILIPQKDKNPRKLTPRECARLQGFPESFKIPVSDTQAYKQFGNSISIPIVECLAKEIIKTLNNIKYN